jgi:hypothetical protein
MRRKVNVYGWTKVDGKYNLEKKMIGTGEFHQWGIDYEELETGPGHFSTAIVEMDDGTVKNVCADLIVFLK